MGVHVVAKLVAFAEHLQRKVVQRAPDEPVDDPVALLLAPLKRAVRIGDAEHHEAEAALALEHLEVALGGELVGAVDGDGGQQAVLGHRQLLVRRVDEAGARKDHARGGREVGACHEHVEQRPQVDVEVLDRGRVADRRA